MSNQFPQAPRELLQTVIRSLPVIAMMAGAAVAPAAVAQTFPSKPIRLVVPAAPGGGTDILARLLSPELTKQFGQQIVIENRAGGATMIGTEFVARSAPDGHTMVIATTPHAINPTLKGFETSGWYALLGPAGIPRDVTLRIHDGFSKVLHNPEITKNLASRGVEVLAGTPDELAKVMPAEIKKWGAVVKSSGATPG